MEISQIVTILVILVFLAVITESVSKALKLPYSMLLITVGYVFSEIFIAFGYDTGIRSTNFQELIFFVFLPALIFESAYQSNIDVLFKNIGSILFLAIIGMVITTVVTAAGLYYGIAHDSGFPWEAALLAGALLAATDPVAVVAQVKQLGAPTRLAVVLEGESLFNDATAIVIFSLLLSFALMSGEPLSTAHVMKEFTRIFLGGVVVGIVAGFIGVALLRLFSSSLSRRLLTMLAAYTSYLVAELVFHVSGVTATLIAGLCFSVGASKYLSQSTCIEIQSMWELIGHSATSLVFLVTGITVYMEMFRERWLAILIAIGAVLAARILTIYIALPMATIMSKSPIPKNYRPIMVWGGLRGAVTIALAFSLPEQLDYWWTIQSIAFGVVIFTLFVQAPSCRWLIKRVL